MRKITLLFISALCLSFSGCTQELKSGRFIFYNTENFFDTIKDPKTDDGDFTPAGKNHWTGERYQHKLTNIAKVLGAISAKDAPIAIGLSEVENRKVCEDLAAQAPLSKYNFGVIEHDSPDPRGIDVALLYRKKYFTPLSTEFLNVKLPGSNYGTRDILYVKGTVKGVSLHIFVNHWPSRRDGKESSEYKRDAAAEVLHGKVAQILAADQQARIIIMGDLNDNPTDSSVAAVLGACEPSAKVPGLLYNLMSHPYKTGAFTLKYHDQKDVFDQFIVSGNLLDTKAAVHARSPEGDIFSEQWLLFDHPKYGYMPNRTYSGPRYYGGFSDHLPVYFDLDFSLK